MKDLYLLFISILVLQSCSSDQFELPDNANKLLTGNSSKTWKLAKRYNGGHRMNMGDCFLSYRVTYNAKGTTTDNNSLNTNCGESMDANWSFHTQENGSYIKLKGEKVKTLFNQDKDYKFFKINNLSDTLLILSFKHKQFGNTERIIEDHLVPETLNVEGRNYHN